MASALFPRLLNDLCLEVFFRIHLLEPSVLVFEFLEVGHQRGVHAPKFATPFVERGGTDAVFSAGFRDRAAALCLLGNGDDLVV